ncbi:hypothetical protein M422DRAFT_28544 [Sphaerobolus stellatus SS14]|uniref:Peptidase A1 domain-containing protein n=1 Tax=Sphaerobolus stellatus (strain SS14) TaxID=990650 RepID=A0A0C9W4X8_SPHS4|nr:hypothetical protein M422DRAFT_28544 [Sphaerobolus stellatus SS14]
MARSFFPLLLLFIDFSDAFSIPVQGRQAPRLGRRQNNKQVTQLDDQGNTNYLANITMGGSVFSVTIDTGSSDLWVQKAVPNAQTTNFQASVTYAVGEVTGPVKLVDTTFSGITVKNQAYIEVPAGGNSGAGNSDGLIGLGPSTGSQVRSAVGSSTGDPFLDNAFRADPSSPNIITVLLSRTGDGEGTDVQGEFSVGTVASGLTQINSQPKLPVISVPVAQQPNQHWTSQVDGIIGPDGQKMNLVSEVAGTPNGSLVAVYDSGFTLPQVPATVSNAIYSGIPGANFDQTQGFWTIPCEQEVNLTFIIGGQNFPIHPFDTGLVLSFQGDDGGNLCAGAFQPISTTTDASFDMIMGMAFLRNAYMLINFGDFVDGNPAKQGQPFMQLLPTTTASAAHQQFVKSRLGGVDTTGSQPRPHVPTDFSNVTTPSSSSPSVASQDFNTAKSFIQRNWIYFAAGGGGLAALIIGACIFSSVRRRRRTGPRYAYPSAVFATGAAGSYKQLHDPAPGAAMDEHGTHGGFGGYAGQQSYPPRPMQPYHPAGGYGEGGMGYVDPYGRA